MKHALFATESEALTCAAKVQTACNSDPVAAHAELDNGKGAIYILPAWIEWMGKWSVPLPVEVETGGEIVDSIDRPVEVEPE